MCAPAPAHADPEPRPRALAVAASLYAAGRLEEAEAAARTILSTAADGTLAATAARLVLFAAARERKGHAGYEEGAAGTKLAPAAMRDLLDDYLLDATASHYDEACSGVSDEAVAAWKKLLAGHPAPATAARARWGLARTYTAKGSFAEAQKFLAALLDAPPEWLDRAEARFRAAALNASLGKDAAARAGFLRVFLEHPRSRWAGEARTRLAAPDAAAFDKLLTPARHLDHAEALLAARAPEEACPEIHAVWAARPAPPLDLRAGTLEARCLLVAKDYGGAGALREDLSDRGRKRGDLAAAATHLFEAAKAHAGKHKGDASPERAVDDFDRFAAEFPTDARVPEARFLAAFTLFTLDETALAVARFDAFLAEHPDDDRAPAALWYAGWARWTSGDVAGAEKKFAALAARAGPDARKGAYWQARALEARAAAGAGAPPAAGPLAAGAGAPPAAGLLAAGAGAPPAAGPLAAALKIWRSLAEREPFGWYGLLARARLAAHGVADAPFGRATPPPAPPRRPPADDPVGDGAWRFVFLADASAAAALPPGATAPAARRALALLAAGLRPEAATALRAAGPAIEKAAGRPTLLELLDAADDHSATRRMAAAAAGLARVPTGADRRDWTLAFPIAFEAEVAAAAAAHGVPASFLYAIMHKESGFDPRVVSYADAVGLMQLLPKTARKIAARRGVPFDEPALFRPAANVDTAGWYLGHLSADFAGQLPLVAAAYNGGPPAVRRWLDAFGGRPLDEFVESVTYQQSREYIKKVSALYARYVYLYEAALWLPAARVDARYGTDIDF